MAKGTIERRIVADQLEVRKNGDGTTGLHGYAAVFDSPAHGEVIKRSAFNRTLAQRDNVRFLVNHEGVALASTRAGTMTLGVDDHGLWFDIPALDTANPRVQEVVSAVDRGDLYQCSFAFVATDDPTVDGLREVREAKLYDVSGVTYPWYEDTEIGVTGNRTIDGAVLALRGAPLTVDARSAALKALRAAPPGKESYNDMGIELSNAIYDMLAAATGADPWMWLEDFGDDWAVYCVYGDHCNYFQVGYSVDSAGVFTFDTPQPVTLVSEWRPVTIADLEPVTMREYTAAEARALLGAVA